MENTPETAFDMQSLTQPSFSCEVRHIPLKRIFDVLFSILALIFSFPVFLLIASILWLSCRGKIIYAHERIGRGGKPFRCYKFRTMYPDADNRLNEILNSSPHFRKEWEESRKLKNDPRITPIGNFLRKTSLDELPQFWNVVKGDLSVVGPRPIVREELEVHFAARAEKILSVRPGLTGPWQVSGRSDTSYLQRMELDESYVNNQSFWWDLQLIMLTIPAMMSHKGAY